MLKFGKMPNFNNIQNAAIFARENCIVYERKTFVFSKQAVFQCVADVKKRWCKHSANYKIDARNNPMTL